jgi:ABC-type phosphate transport system substrate-binding protein
MSVAILAAWLALSAPSRTEAPQERFVVVVNAANPESSADAETLSAVFLKQRKKWPNGERVVPVDQSLLSALRSFFVTAVFGQQSSAIQAYWEGEVSAGRDSPPAVRSGDEEVLAFVAANVGAIGYVDRGAKLPPKVKLLRFVR